MVLLLEYNIFVLFPPLLISNVIYFPVLCECEVEVICFCGALCVWPLSRSLWLARGVETVECLRIRTGLSAQEGSFFLRLEHLHQDSKIGFLLRQAFYSQ